MPNWRFFWDDEWDEIKNKPNPAHYDNMKDYYKDLELYEKKKLDEDNKKKRK